MNTMITSLIISVSVFCYICSSPVYSDDVVKIDDNEINKILKAKDIVRGIVKYPDTLVFHEFHTKVSGNTVTLKFTAKNAFGVAETFVKDIKVN